MLAAAPVDAERVAAEDFLDIYVTKEIPATIKFRGGWFTPVHGVMLAEMAIDAVGVFWQVRVEGVEYSIELGHSGIALVNESMRTVKLRLFKVLCQHKNTQPISSQIECVIKPTFEEDGQLG